MDIISVKDPKKYNISGELGLALNNSAFLMKEGRFNDALSICDECLKKDPNNALMLTQKGTAHFRLGKFDDAIRCFDLAIKSSPKFADAYYNKATVKALQDDIPEALSLLEQSIKLDSRFRKTAKRDEDFLLLRDNPLFIVLVGN
ncbi:MAG: tetratricopeptide repeat protein [Thaumarchaeota archaeon]|nr:tetratricopeptide repeat protein [Nitrososphaerota archaeon]